MYKRFGRKDNLFQKTSAKTTLLPVAPSLKVLSGNNKGKRFVIDSDLVTIGTAQDNVVRLEHDKTISDKHAQICKKGDKYFIVDLDSTNGTFVNSNKIKEVELSDGSIIGIGNARLRFEGSRVEFSWRLKDRKRSRHVFSRLAGLVIILIVVIIAIYYLSHIPSPEVERHASGDRCLHFVPVVKKSDADSGRAGEYFIKGMAEYNRGNFEQAILYLNKILEIEPEHRSAGNYIEMAYKNIQDSKKDSGKDKILSLEGKKSEEKDTEIVTGKVKKKQELAEVYYRKGRINYANQDLKGALKNWEKALKIINDPEDELYKQTLEKIKGIKKQGED